MTRNIFLSVHVIISDISIKLLIDEGNVTLEYKVNLSSLFIMERLPTSERTKMESNMKSAISNANHIRYELNEDESRVGE